MHLLCTATATAYTNRLLRALQNILLTSLVTFSSFHPRMSMYRKQGAQGRYQTDSGLNITPRLNPTGAAQIHSSNSHSQINDINNNVNININDVDIKSHSPPMRSSTGGKRARVSGRYTDNESPHTTTAVTASEYHLGGMDTDAAGTLA